MRFQNIFLRAGVLISALALSISAWGEEVPIEVPESRVSFVDRASSSMQDAIEQGLGMIGVRYKRGGSNPAAGFDCSGLVSHVFREGLGIDLPHSSREISKAADVIDKEDLRPGDLVFFNTMRRAFSHVGIYLGDNQFLHAPRAGARVRIDDMSLRYWARRFNGARRVSTE